MLEVEVQQRKIHIDSETLKDKGYPLRTTVHTKL